MSAICDFYIECAERNVCPIEDMSRVPPHIPRVGIVVKSRRGDDIDVTGITLADAFAWEGRPQEVSDFLETFAWVAK